MQLHPLTRVINQIQNDHIKEALLARLGGAQRNTLSPGEIGGLFKVGAENDRTVRGHDMTESELADYVLIHAQGGSHLFKSEKAAKTYAAELKKFTGLPKVEIVETDPGLGFKSKVAVNKAVITGTANGDLCPSGVMCVIGGPTTVSLKVNGETFSVEPRAGEGHASIAQRLKAEVEMAGFKVSVTSQRAKSTLTVGAQRQLQIANLTTDRMVRMGVRGNQISVDVGIGGPMDLAGGRIGLKIGGKDYSVPTTAGEPARIALELLRRQIEVAGFEVKVAGLPTIDTISELWTVRPATYPWVNNGGTTTLEGTVRVEGQQSFLDLAHPIRVDNNIVKSLSLQFGSDVAAGAAKLSGTVTVMEGETFPVQLVARLTGFTNVTAGQPERTEDGKWLNSLGKECDARYLPRPEDLLDAPNTVVVFDQSHDTAFLGASGGMPNPHNPSGFYGFHGSRAIDVTPSRADLAAVQFRLVNDTPGGGRAREEWPHNRAGQPLAEMHGPGRPETVAGRRYFMDRASETIYVFDIAGPQDRVMAQVIKKPAGNG